MYLIKSKTILTPQNGLNVYHGITDPLLVNHMPPSVRREEEQHSGDIGMKKDAPELLHMSIRKRGGRGMIQAGNYADPYNSLEAVYKLMRRCLAVISASDYGIAITTRRELILRDLDILSEIATRTRCVVEIPFPSPTESTLRRMEGIPERADGEFYVEARKNMIRSLRKWDIPVIMDIGPILPEINDRPDEILSLLDFAAESGVKHILTGGLRTRLTQLEKKEFYTRLKERFPEQYYHFLDTFGMAGELIPRRADELAHMISDYTAAFSLETDETKIREFKRKYENQTEGEQLSFDFSLS